MATYIAANESLFNNIENESNENSVNFLCDFKGIGRWSAEYILLRGLGKIEIFPGDDVGDLSWSNLKWP